MTKLLFIMLSNILFLPLISAFIVGISGRKIGITGTNIIVIGTLLISTIMSITLSYEIIIAGSSVSLEPLLWLDTGKTIISWGFSINPLNAWLISTVLSISLLVHIFASSYMSGDPNPQKFMSLLLAFTGFMVLLIGGDNLGVLFFGYEGIGITSYLLIGYWFDRALACNAASQAIIVNRVGDTFFTIILVAIIGLTLASGSLDLHDLNFAFNSVFVSTDIINYIGILLVLAAAGKSAQFMLHTWLPNAMEGYDKKIILNILISVIFVVLYDMSLFHDIYCAGCIGVSTIPKKHLEIMTGNLLGDGGIGYSSKEVKPNHNPRFGITLDTYSLPYLQHLFDRVYGIYSKSGIRPWPNVNLSQHKDKAIAQYHFNTRSLPLFKELHNLWYRFNLSTNKYTKIIPTNIKEHFTVISLAYWLMDDGYYQNDDNTIYFCTESFTKQECETLQLLLLDLGIHSGLKLRNKSKDTYRIRISSKSVPLLISLVKPYIHPIFMYKLGSYFISK